MYYDHRLRLQAGAVLRQREPLRRGGPPRGVYHSIVYTI